MQCNKNKKLIIIGASGHGRIVADIALKMKRWSQILFLDDNELMESALGIEIKGKTKEAHKYIHDHDFFVAVGNNKTRETLQNMLIDNSAEIATLIHPTAVIGEQVEIGKGTAVMAGTVINCCTRIGQGCIVNTGATIDHDNIIRDFVHISPGVHIAGTVTIGKRTWIGVGTVVSNNLSITGDCKFGAGSVIVKDIEDPGTYVGVPARRIN